MTGGGMGGSRGGGASLGGVAYLGAGLIARLTGLLFRWGRVEVGSACMHIIYHIYSSTPWRTMRVSSG